jgi:hypothetical protein
MEAGGASLPTGRRRVASARVVALVVGLALSLASTSCGISQQSHFVRPDRYLGDYESFFVRVHPEDSWGIGRMIGDRLRQQDFRVWEGDTQPADAEVVVIYEDRWIWDITMYLLSLRFELRDADTDELLASSQSFRTSMVRKAPDLMVDEVLRRVLAEARK